MLKKVLIFGGAGFIGSNLAKKLVEQDFRVTIVDGLMPDSGGRLENIEEILSDVRFFQSPIEKLDNLQELVNESEIIIDAMAWTLHLAAIKNPFYDMELNCKSHLHLILNIPKGKKVIYLGSRGQYGNFGLDQIDESTVMMPEDVQGIHKLTAELYYKIYSKLIGFDALSIRFPNCFGENQNIYGKEIGLIGSFILDAIKDKEIEVYGKERFRSIIYVQDIVNAIFLLMHHPFKGFDVFNVNGVDIQIFEIAQKIIYIIGSGNVIIKPMPEHIAKIEVGSAKFSEKKFIKQFPKFKKTDLLISLKNTINYFRENLN